VSHESSVVDSPVVSGLVSFNGVTPLDTLVLSVHGTVMGTLSVLMFSNTEFLVGIDSVSGTSFLFLLGSDDFTIINVDLLVTSGLDDLDVLGLLVVWNTGDDDVVSFLNNLLLESVEILESENLLFLGVRSLRSDALDLSEVDSEILVGKLDGSVGLDMDLLSLLSALLGLGVDDDGLGGDVSRHVGVRGRLRVLGNESTDLSLGDIEGFSFTL
jgi:hypothetical protein